MYVRKKEMAQNNKIVCLNKTKKMKEIKKKEVKDNFSKSYMDTVKKLSNSVDKKIKRKVTRESINGEKEEGYMFPFMQSEIEETENYSLDKTNYVKKARQAACKLTGLNACLTVNILGVRALCLVDSGATNSICKQSLIDEINIRNAVVLETQKKLHMK